MLCGARTGAKTRCRASSSISSPNGVPVPCVSISAISVGDFCGGKRRIDRFYLSFYAGATNPSRRPPSLFTAPPLITAYTLSWSRSASSRRFSTTTPAPLLYTVPVASALNGRSVRLAIPAYHLADCSRAPVKPGDPTCQRNIGLKVNNPSHAKYAATNELEQAVCTLTAGPVNPNL